jgi:uroporphyrinogen decarboxylase
MTGHRTHLTSRERVDLALRREPADRVPRAESFWPETIPLWRSQGLSPDTDLAARFGYDIVGAGWVDHQARPGFVEVVEETPQWVTRRDGNGAILRYWKNKSGTPEHVRFTVDSTDKWQALKKDLLAVPTARRVDTEGTLRAMHAAREASRWFCWASVECFEVAKDVVGHEILCCAMAEDPEWARDIYETETDVALRTLDHLEQSGVEYHGAWIYGDIAYNHGPFCSPRMYRELVMPAHARLVNWFKARGLPVIYHTDGDFRPLIPPMLEIGIDCFQPLEAKAGVDVRELKPRYGDRVALMGNIDIMTLITNDLEAVEAEVAAKIPIAKEGGGYIYHSDHSIPPGVTWQTYQFLMDRVESHGRYP